MEAVAHKKGFKLLRSNSEAIAHKTRMGFNLIEAAFVLAVVGGVIGAIWVGAAKVIENQKLTETVNGIFSSAKNIQNLIGFRDAEAIYAAKLGGSGIGFLHAAVPADAFPKNWVVDATPAAIAAGTAVKSPFGYLWLSSYADRLEMWMGPVSQTACIQLTVRVSSIGAMAGSSGSGSGNRSTLGYISIQNDVPVSWNTQTFPITTQTAASHCGSQNTISFVFGLTHN